MSETVVVDTSRQLCVDTRRRSSVLELDFIDSGFGGGSDTSIDLLKQHAFGMISTAQLKLRQSVSTSPAVSPLPSNTSSADDKADFLPIGKQQLQQQQLTSSDISNILSTTGSLPPPCLWATRTELSPYIRDDVRALSCPPHRQQSVVSNDVSGFADEKSLLRCDVAAIKSSLRSALGNGILATPEESSLNRQRTVQQQSTNFVNKMSRQDNDISLLRITDTVNYTTKTTISMQPPAAAADVSCNILVNGDITKSKTRQSDSDEAMTDSEYEALMKKRLQLIFNTYTSPSVKKTSQPATDSRRPDVEKPEVTEQDLLKLRDLIMRTDTTNTGSAADVEDEYRPLPLSANVPSSHCDNIGGSRSMTLTHRNATNYPPLSGHKVEPTLVNDRSHSDEVVMTTPSYSSAAHLKQPVKDDKATDRYQNVLVGKYNHSEPYFGRQFEMKSLPATLAAVGHVDPDGHKTESSRPPRSASSIFQPTISSSTPSRSFALNNITAQTGTNKSLSAADYLALPNQEPLYHDVRKSWHSKPSVSPNAPVDGVNSAGSRISSSKSVSFGLIEKSEKDERTTEQQQKWFDGQQLLGQRPLPTATTTATRSTSADDFNRQTDFHRKSSDSWARIADVDSRASWPSQRTRSSIENETASACYTERSRCGLDDGRGVTTHHERSVVPANTGSERYQPDDLQGTSSGSKWPTTAYNAEISGGASSASTWLAGYSEIQSEKLTDPMQRLNYLRQRQLQQQLEQQPNYSLSIHFPTASNLSTGNGRQWSQPVHHTVVKSAALGSRDDNMEFVVLRCGEIVKRPFLNKPANIALSCMTTGLSSSLY